MSAVDSLGLTDEQVTFFKENGFVGPFDLYPPDEAPLLWNQAKIEMVLSANKPYESTVINYDRHLDCDTLSAHVTRPEIVHKLRSLMGDDVLCWRSNIFKKDPGESGTPRLGYASRYVVPSVKTFDDVHQLSEFGDEISLDYHACILVSGEDTYGYNRLYEQNLNGFPFTKAWP